MSGTTDIAPGPALPDPSPALWRRQVRAIVSLEVFKQFFGRRALPIYFLAGVPVVVMVLRLILPIPKEALGDTARASLEFAWIFNTLYLRVLVFLASILVFTNLFRGEIVNQCLHYFLLLPARRGVLVFGKYLSGVVSTAAVFSASVVAAYILMLAAHGGGDAIDFLTSGPGIPQLLAYVGTTVLAFCGYGALFLLIGLLVKNPILPALAIWGWEWLNFLLPAMLKKVSIIHYLQSLTPVPIDQGPLAVIAEPTSVWIAVPGVLALSGVLLFLSTLFVRRMEIRYGTE